jgi:hypothetical protein
VLVFGGECFQFVRIQNLRGSAEHARLSIAAGDRALFFCHDDDCEMDRYDVRLGSGRVLESSYEVEQRVGGHIGQSRH